MHVLTIKMRYLPIHYTGIYDNEYLTSYISAHQLSESVNPLVGGYLHSVNQSCVSTQNLIPK